MLATADESTREQRLREGLCPACGTRLYKVVRKGGIATVKTLFNKKDTTANSAADVKMIPLTLPGVVERGQCMKCSGHEVAIGAASSVPPAVKAVPVVVRSPAAAYAAAAQGDDDQDLLCMLEAEAANPDSLHNSDHKFSKSDRSCSMYSTDTEYEDVPLLDIANMDLRDPFSSSMKYDKSESTGEDHPDFLVAIPDASLESYFEPKQEVDKSVERIQRLREEAQDWSQALGVASVAAAIPSKPQALDCPDGMSPDVFYQLPPEVQKEVSQSGAQSLGASLADIDPDTLASLPESVRREVMEQTSASSRGNSEKQVAFAPEKITLRKTNHLDRKPLSKSTKVFLEEYDIKEDDFDALDEDVQKDLLGIKASQKQKETIDCSDRSDKMGRSNLSKSTKDFLSGFDINEHDFNDFDEEVKSDLLREKQRSSLSTSVSSTYDPETLASLPEDLRNEVLNQEKREKEQQQQKNREDRRAVGAHSVNVPAGYDPDTFEALPLEVQQELMDAAQNGVVYAADGYEYDSIVRAPIVEATSVGQERATYEGDYNSAGKRHGEGTLEWANGDVYVGRFRNGFIDGTGTITFHDGTEYSGQWQRNRFHGDGTRRFRNGNVYSGNYIDGKRHGQGKCYFANGDLYSGDWKNDTIQGFGRYYYNNGHSFEGMFRNGMRNGRGKYQLTDGRVEIYRYVNDKRAGDGVRWSADRKKAWKMNDGKAVKRISTEEATAIANRCGPVLEDS